MNVALFCTAEPTPELLALGQRVVQACGPAVRIHRLADDETAGRLTQQRPDAVVHTPTATVPPWRYRTHQALLRHRTVLLKILSATDYGLVLGELPKPTQRALCQTLRYVNIMLIDVEHNADEIETILRILSTADELPEKATPE